MAFYLSNHGNTHRFACPYTSKQNGIVERKHRHLLLCFSLIDYLVRFCPIYPPHEKLCLKSHDYDFLRVFTCLCYPLLRPNNKHRWDFRFARYVFLGYCSNQHGYKFLDSYGRVYISRHVRFQEVIFPFAEEKGKFMQSAAVKNLTTSAPFFFPFKPEFDFQDTFSPVVKASTVHIVLKLALTHKWCLKKVNVNNAFLHGELNEEEYRTQPPGFEQCDDNGRLLVCKLNKALYGLKQAPKAWFERFKHLLLNTLQFTVSLANFCLFIKNTE